MFWKKGLMQSRSFFSRPRFMPISQMAMPMATSFRAFSTKDNFMSGANANYIDFMYSQWQ